MKIEIGEKIYDLEFTINSVCDLEETTGRGLADILSVEGMTSIRALLWCGLIESNRTLTLKQAGDLLQEYLQTHSVDDFTTIIGGALEQAGFIQAAAKRRPKK